MLEEQIFRLEPELSPFVLGGAESFWKLLLSCLLIPMFQYIPCPEQVCEGGRLEELGRAIDLLYQDSTLCNLVVVSSIFAALQ